MVLWAASTCWRSCKRKSPLSPQSLCRRIRKSREFQKIDVYEWFTDNETRVRHRAQRFAKCVRDYYVGRRDITAFFPRGRFSVRSWWFRPDTGVRKRVRGRKAGIKVGYSSVFGDPRVASVPRLYILITTYARNWRTATTTRLSGRCCSSMRTRSFLLDFVFCVNPVRPVYYVVINIIIIDIHWRTLIIIITVCVCVHAGALSTR